MIVAGSSITLFSLLFIPLFGLSGAAYAYSLGFAIAAVTDIVFYLYGKMKNWFRVENIHI